MKNCPACKKENPEIAIFCERCQFPFEGTEKEKAIHIGKFVSKKGVVFDSDVSIDRSRNILGIITLFNTGFLIMSAFQEPFYIEDFIINAVVTLIFLWCMLTIKKNPFVKILIPLSLLIVINVVNFIIEPATLAQGILFKIAFIGSLFYSLFMIRSSQNFKNKYEK